MKPYACFPRTQFRPAAGSFVNPYAPQFYTRNEGNQAANAPAANIIRKDDAYVIELAVPGFGKEDIKIEFINEQLVISATAAKQETELKFVRREFDYTGFKRNFRLHKNANTEALTATFDQGILTIVVPDKEPVSRKIEIL